jgi:hypothetical protein
VTSVAERVQKLIALSASPQIEEARTSAYLACKLIREHGLALVALAPPPAPAPRRDPPPRPQAPTEDKPVRIRARYSSNCRKCGKHVDAGEPVLWTKGKGVKHERCA